MKTNLLLHIENLMACALALGDAGQIDERELRNAIVAAAKLARQAADRAILKER
jgi:hypothetical protein